MELLLAAIPATGHFNPILVASRILKEAGYEQPSTTSVVFRDKACSGVRALRLSQKANGVG
jgi:hypothetical protein